MFLPKQYNLLLEHDLLRVHGEELLSVLKDYLCLVQEEGLLVAFTTYAVLAQETSSAHMCRSSVSFWTNISCHFANRGAWIREANKMPGISWLLLELDFRWGAPLLDSSICIGNPT
jgi:hypothetical protein